MALMLHRRTDIDRIEIRIARLRERATKLLEDEQHLDQRLQELRKREMQQLGRLRRRRVTGSLERIDGRLSRLRAQRSGLVEHEMQSIMLSLQEQSKRTRERLDRELARLEPIAAEWERMRSTFDALQETVSTPALEELAAQWQGELTIPEFPVQEREGYAKPFPQSAVVF